jgi:crotonyl-CoA reductase
MIVSKNGSQMTQGQAVLIWGATGGIGAYATQYVLNGGGTPVGVVSSEKRAEVLRAMGCEAVIDRRAENYKFWNDDDTEQDPAEWLRLGKKVRSLVGRDVDIVFEHPGRSTMGASVFVAKRGGMIITCAATSGFKIEYDNRYLWMNLKTLKGCHFANYREAWEANRLVGDARIHPTMSKVYPLDQTGEAALQVHHNLVEGKVSVLCLAPEEGLGVTDDATRERHLDQITLFRRMAV